MARFLGSVLRYLGSGYKISGSEVRTDQLDLGGVQLVQDVSSLVASGRGPGLFDGRFIAYAGVNVLADGGSTNETVELNPFVNPGGLVTWWPPEGISDELDLWLYGISGEFIVEQAPSNPVFQDARVWLTTPNRYGVVVAGLAGSPPDHAMLLAVSTESSGLESGARRGIRWNLEGTGLIPGGREVWRWPIFIPPGSRLWLRGQGSGDNDGGTAAVIRANFYLRAVPRGFPPGP